MKEIEVRTYSDFVDFLFDWQVNAESLQFTCNDGTIYILDDPKEEENLYQLLRALFAKNFLREFMDEEDDDETIHEGSANEVILIYSQRYYHKHKPEPVKYKFIFD